jgi:UDP-N-acetylglucosamine--dolichyl-phosphate N-acetylglucosaminephosphotransferase
MDFLILFLFAAVSFAITFFSTPVLIASATSKKIFGTDDNKLAKPKVPFVGGLAIFAGMASAVLLSILYFVFLHGDSSTVDLLFAALSAIMLLALIGVFDDFFKLSWKTKSFLPIVGSFPLVAIKAGETVLRLPFFGAVDFGVFYTFILIPLGVTGSANAVNMAAGYNGIEAGSIAIVSAFLLFIAVQANALPSAVILAATLGACLAFLKYNWFPAKVFPGDVGTLVLGAAVASAVIIGNMESYGVILFIPAFYELAATVYYYFKNVERRKACHNPVISKGGFLSPPKGTENYTLFYKILSFRPMREKTLVKTVLALYFACGLVALALFYSGA